MFNHPSSRRGRGARPFPSPVPQSSLPPDRSLIEGLAKEAIKAVDKPSSTTVDKDKEVKITDFEYIGSYNWTKDETPTIIVPGKQCFYSFSSTSTGTRVNVYVGF